ERRVVEGDLDDIAGIGLDLAPDVGQLELRARADRALNRDDLDLADAAASRAQRLDVDSGTALARRHDVDARPRLERDGADVERLRRAEVDPERDLRDQARERDDAPRHLQVEDPGAPARRAGVERDAPGRVEEAR